MRELRLSGLAETKSRNTVRHPEEAGHEALSSSLYRWTEGHPFMVNLAAHLVDLGDCRRMPAISVELTIPDNLLEMPPVDDAERHRLEVASVFGEEWSAALLAP